MVSTTTILEHIGILASQNLPLAYFIIYLATIFLGNVSAFAGFWFAAQGYFGPWGIPFLIATVFLANFSGDLLWYTLGRKLHKTRFGNWIKNHIPGYEKIAGRVERNGKRLIFLAKFLYSSSFPVIFAVGWTQMEFRRFVRTSILSILLWLPILLGLAYAVISGLSPLDAVDDLKRFEVTFLIGLVLFLVLDYLIAKLFRKFFDR